MLNAQCSMLSAQCSVLSAQCPIARFSALATLPTLANARTLSALPPADLGTASPPPPPSPSPPVLTYIRGTMVHRGCMQGSSTLLRTYVRSVEYGVRSTTHATVWSSVRLYLRTPSKEQASSLAVCLGRRGEVMRGEGATCKAPKEGMSSVWSCRFRGSRVTPSLFFQFL